MRKWTSLILTILIVFQSMVAMADVHRAHQSGSDHVEFKHGHEADSTTSQSDSDEIRQKSKPVGQFDCHHCCHCHGVAHAFLAANTSSMQRFCSAQTFAAYSVKYPSLSILPDLRPPIV